MILALFIPLLLVAFLFLAIGFYGDFKPSAIAVGAIIVMLLGVFIGSESLEYRTGDTTKIDQLDNYTNYENYTKEGTNETVIKVGAIKTNGTETTTLDYQTINDNLKTFLSAGLIIAGLGLFIRLIISFLPEHQKIR